MGNQKLQLGPDVFVTSMVQGPFPMSWTNVAFRPPYLIATLCSDGGIRFWTIEASRDKSEASLGLLLF